MGTKKKYTYEQFTAIRRYGYATSSFSPDGSEIAYTVNTSGQFNLWRQPSAGGFPHQLTTFTEQAVRVVSWSPEGAHIAFNADHHGDENHQVYVISSKGGQPEAITARPEVQHELSARAWSRDGRYLGYNANDRTPASMDILVYDLEKGEANRVLAGDAYYAFGGWAPDSQKLLAIDVKSNTNLDIYLVDLRQDSSRLLTEHDGEVKYIPGPWTPDSSGFYFLTDQGCEFTGLAFYELESGTWKWIETPDWDVESVDSSPDGNYLAWVVNEAGYSRLYVRDMRSGQLLDLPDIPEGVIFEPIFSPEGSKLAFFLMQPTHCAELLVLDLKERSLNQITHSMLGGIDERDLVTPSLIDFSTFDGRQIPAWLYKPEESGATNRVPAILSIHGGPEAQERPLYIYSGMYQYWTSQGIAVLAPNIRGSTGYGKTYQQLIHRDWGGGELKDIEAAVKFLLSLDWVDPDRIGIFGGSFGGFATLSAVSRLPDYWAAAVDIVGPSNLVTFANAVPPHWRRFIDEILGNPQEDYDMLVERSPITYVDQIKTPLFIIQGAKDPRVVKSESDQIVERLRDRGVDVRYDVYEDEGHGFTKRENELKAWRDTAEFFEKYLLM